ncbi:MAG: hypothetical protein IPO12_09230 [Flavobacteriales bacterium]|nr:hypothetical protein [Flavobacteriales bacterium]
MVGHRGDTDITMTFDPRGPCERDTRATSVVRQYGIVVGAARSLPGFNAFGISVQLNVPVGLALGTPISAIISVTQDSTEVSLANNTFTLDR